MYCTFFHLTVALVILNTSQVLVLHSAYMYCIHLFVSVSPSGSMWNAATFYQESSYLYFPTSPAELASDISFYFKTGAPSGVFVESLGLKDFVRVELSCESTVMNINKRRNAQEHHMILVVLYWSKLQRSLSALHEYYFGYSRSLQMKQ